MTRQSKVGAGALSNSPWVGSTGAFICCLMALSQAVSEARISVLDVLDSMALVVGWGTLEVEGWEDAVVAGGWSSDMVPTSSRWDRSNK